MKSSSHLEGKTVVLELSDPWDLGESLEWKVLQATVIKQGIQPESGFGSESESIIIRLKEPFTFKGLNYEYLQGSPRHEGDSFRVLRRKKSSVFCSFTRIPPEQVASAAPFDLSWWRGGGGVIATISF